MEHPLALEDMHLAPVWADESGGGGGASTQALVSSALVHSWDC